MLPEALEGLSPIVKRADRIRIGLVQDLAAVATAADEAYVAQHAQMLGYGRLFQAEGCDDLPDRALLEGQIVQDVAAAGFGDRVKSVGGGRGSCHEGKYIYLYGHMSTGNFCGTGKIGFTAEDAEDTEVELRSTLRLRSVETPRSHPLFSIGCDCGEVHALWWAKGPCASRADLAVGGGQPLL